RRISLVQLGVDVAEGFLEAIARQRARGWREALLRPQVGEILHDRRALGEYLTVIQLQCRHVALRVDGDVVSLRGHGLGLQVHLLQTQLDTGLMGNDVRREGARPARVKQLHMSLLGSRRRKAGAKLPSALTAV